MKDSCIPLSLLLTLTDTVITVEQRKMFIGNSHFGLHPFNTLLKIAWGFFSSERTNTGDTGPRSLNKKYLQSVCVHK